MRRITFSARLSLINIKSNHFLRVPSFGHTSELRNSADELEDLVSIYENPSEKGIETRLGGSLTTLKFPTYLRRIAALQNIISWTLLGNEKMVHLRRIIFTRKSSTAREKYQSSRACLAAGPPYILYHLSKPSCLPPRYL